MARTKKMGLCTMDGCANEQHHTELELCYTCYANMRRWRENYSDRERQRRAGLVARWHARMDLLTGGKRIDAKYTPRKPKEDSPPEKKNKKR